MKIKQFVLIGIILVLAGCVSQRSFYCWTDDQETADCRYSYYQDGKSITGVFKPRGYCPKPIHCDDQYHYDDTFHHDGTASFDAYHVKKGCGYCSKHATGRNA